MFDLRPLDVILTGPKKKPPWYAFRDIPARQIISYQERSGYQQPLYTHARLVRSINPNLREQVFSLTWPKAEWESIGKMRMLADRTDTLFHVYRLSFPITWCDLHFADQALMELMGNPEYDWGQLVSFLLNEKMNVPLDRFRPTFFDTSPKQRVCSVGVRYIFDRINQQYRALDETPPWFVRWHYDGITIDIDRTPPAQFAEQIEFGWMM